jgi:chromosome segregation ATPase
MQRVQKEQCNQIEAQIKNVDEKLSSMKGKNSTAADIKFLTGKISEWNKKVEELSIPSGPHSKSHNISATASMTKIQTTWEKFCENDPVIQKAALYEEKDNIEKEISKLSSDIDALQKKIPSLKAEYEDRNNNSEKYEKQVNDEVGRELDTISTEIRHAEEDVEDLEKNKKSIMMQLDSTGLFAFGKKKELKVQVEKLDQDISAARDKVKELEQKKVNAENSKNEKLSGLTQAIEKLKLDIETSERELNNKKEQLDRKSEELKALEAKL